MKKWIAISMILVFAVYGFCVYAGIDMFIPLWILLAACGLVFWVSDGMVIRASNPRNLSFLDINQSELDYSESTRRKAAQDKSPVTTIIVAVAVAVAVCLVHCYMSPIDEEKIIHDQNYGVRYTLDETGHKQSSVRINLDMNGSDTITALMIAYQSSNSYSEDTVQIAGMYPEDVSYGDELPIVYMVQTQETGVLEMIFQNFHEDGFMDSEPEAMMNYLGLTEEWKDKVITWQELKDSDTFRFKEILQKGEYMNNISFAGEEKYNVEEVQE